MESEISFVFLRGLLDCHKEVRERSSNNSRGNNTYNFKSFHTRGSRGLETPFYGSLYLVEQSSAKSPTWIHPCILCFCYSELTGSLNASVVLVRQGHSSDCLIWILSFYHFTFSFSRIVILCFMITAVKLLGVL